MKIHDSDDVLFLLERSAKDLTQSQRLVALLYAASEQRADGAVLVRASELAAAVGMTGPAFSRTRKEMVEKGWLEEAGTIGRLKVYRLPSAISRQRVGGHLRVVGE
ncbi:replication initiation protein, RepL2 [Streptomyces sp. NPDC050485]|uniref:replication initiation protein, RepL2 n=1 Tax=Streptomyces sp. NPDC050485 TaxID=3365617 RepID=UPI0037A96B43